jgi:hypothetical protein
VAARVVLRWNFGIGPASILRCYDFYVVIAPRS